MSSFSNFQNKTNGWGKNWNIAATSDSPQFIIFLDAVIFFRNNTFNAFWEIIFLLCWFFVFFIFYFRSLTEKSRSGSFPYDGQFNLTVPQWKIGSQLPLVPTPPPYLPQTPSHFIRLLRRRLSLASPSSTPLCTLDSSWWCTSNSGCCTCTNTKDGAIRVSSCSSVCSGLPSALFCSPFTFVTLWKPTTYLLHSTGCSTASLCVCSSSLSALLTCILLR